MLNNEITRAVLPVETVSEAQAAPLLHSAAAINLAAAGLMRSALLIPAGLRIAPSVLGGFLAGGLMPLATDPSLPLANSRAGNVFHDRFETSLFWYLPGYAPADDTDAAFSFTAVQAGNSVQNSGTGSSVTPFDTARVTFSLKKLVPADVTAAQGQNPGARFQEIPFTSLNVTLTVGYKLPDGTDQQSAHTGQVAVEGDGTLLVTLDGLVGTAVVLLYENLMQTGGASVGLTLSYAVWNWMPPRPSPPRPFPPFPPRPFPPFGPGPHPMPEVQSFAPSLVDRPVTLQSGLSLQDDFPTVGENAPPTGSYTQGTALMTLSLSLGPKYADGRYRPSYTLTVGGVTRPILDVTDLTQFNTPRSEFSEFQALGDISIKYPSLRRLYLGEVSRVIVVLPASYGIVRSSTGCAALCQALVDPSAASASGSRFHFAFTVAPVISPIEIVQLSQDLAALPAVKDCTLTFPTGLDARIPADFSDPFVSTPAVAGGLVPHSFLFSLDIADGAAGTMPAAASVNLFLRQLGAPLGTPLFGHFGVRLDDDYAPPLQADLVLNLHATSGGDDSAVSLTAAPPSVVISNNAPFDLLLARYAVTGGSGLTATPLAETLGAGQTVTLPLPPGDYSGVFVDDTLALTPQVTNADLTRYIIFQTQDVQEVKSWLGVNAAGVDFAGLGITQITLQIALTGLPELVIVPLTLTPGHLIDSTQILVPIEDAITSLAASLSLTVQGSDPSLAASQVTLTNDFSVNPVFVLTSSALAPSPAPGPDN